MTALDQALQIARMEPLPQDARAQIEKLRADIHEFEFEFVLEALAISEMEQGEFDESDEEIGGPD